MEESVGEGRNVTLCLDVVSDLECPIEFPFEYFLSTSGQNPSGKKNHRQSDKRFCSIHYVCYGMYIHYVDLYLNL